MHPSGLLVSMFEMVAVKQYSCPKGISYQSNTPECEIKEIASAEFKD